MKNRNFKLKAPKELLMFTGLLLGWFLPTNVHAQLKVSEETKTILTYEIQPANKMPFFYEGRSHQGVQRHIYPYPYDDGLTNIKNDKDHHIIRMENEYIEIGVMPLMGGRIYYAYDKTNGFNWIYENHVVKPSLIGMIGNWVSGSLGWGYPHHHGPTTVEAMDYKIEKNPDGSQTVWISCTDRTHRLNALVGYTVYPNSSLIDMTIHPRNRTAMGNSFLFWANPAVHADSAYQVIFPPSVQYVTFHHKRYMTTWPVADGWFNNYDFSGIDVSWWKNTHIPSSYFSWDPKEGYFGGYNHREKGGTVWLGNRYISPGMKYWADGNNASGRRTNDGLTDNDGQYIELMAGFYTDNQPDYSWLQPYETKIGVMSWFPIRELDGLKYANRNGAMNYELTGNSLTVKLNTTTANKNAKLVVKAKGKDVGSKVMDISPDKPQKFTFSLPANTTEDDLEIALYTSGSDLLLDYRPIEHHPPKYSKPEPLKPFPAPEDIESVEELYLAGLRLNQFFNASIDPMPYYNEALKRDPGNFRVNTQLGILSIKGHNWDSAEKYLQTAVDRITSNYTRPKDGEALYYLALTKRALGKTDEAYELFYRATWDYAWHTAGYYQLAEMDCERKDWQTAIEHLNRSISTNTNNNVALNLKAVVLRKMNHLNDAKQLLETILEKHKIVHFALNELSIVNAALGNTGKAAEDLKELERIMRDDVQSYMELGTEYQHAGLYEEALNVLSRLEKKGATYPMLYYQMGYYSEKSGKRAEASAYYQKASKMPYDYCFPFRSEEMTMLQYAMKMNPSDSKAPYYLGNLLYESQPGKAIEEWEKSARLDDSFYIVQRNLGYAYREMNDYSKALAYMEKAVKNNNTDARLLYEVDMINELNKVPLQQKYDFLKRNQQVAMKRAETLLRLATRAVEVGKYDEAIEILTTNDLPESEGARGRESAFLNSYTLRAVNYINNSNSDAALKDLETALDYPVGLNGRSRYAQFYYLSGLACSKKGDNTKAKEYFLKAAETPVTERGTDREFAYFKGLALKELNKDKEAREIFQNLLNTLNDDRSAFFTSFEGGRINDTQLAVNFYLSGLANKGLGNEEKAKENFREALKYNPSHVWSKIFLDGIL